MSEWKDFKLNKQLFNAIEEAGFRVPTGIQEKCIPLILGGQQVIGIAQTGTGKTAAYLLPLLMKTKYAQGKSPRVLILVPTKELVLQVTSQAETLAKYTDLRILGVYGGVGPKRQIESLGNGVDILISTPGRLMEFYLKKDLITKSIDTLVIDEADRMMDMGFISQLRKTFDIIPRKRQNLLFSATFPEKVERLAEDFLEFPTKVEVTPQATPAKTVKQVYYLVPNLKTKINFLEHLLKRDEFSRVIIFTKTKSVANNVYKFIERKSLGTAQVLHSNKAQNTRINAINQFKEGQLKILVSTDVASRGIDITGISHVINFDVPVRYEDYVHRIGRTGRASEVGEAISMVTEDEVYHLAKIEKLIREKIPQKKLPLQVKIEPTPFEEAQEIARAIDHQKRKEDPTFKGAFHDKKEPQGRRKKKGR